MAGPLRKLTQEQVDESVRMYDSGLSLGDIAGEMGVTRQAMHSLLKRRTSMRSNLRFGSDNHFHRGGRRSHDPAHNKLEKAIQRGDLVRPDTCESCGEKPKAFADGRHSIHAHHDDYNMPLDVRWLCQPCHHEWHRHNAAKEAAE